MSNITPDGAASHFAPKGLLRQYRVRWRRPNWKQPRYTPIIIDPVEAERAAHHVARGVGQVAEVVIESRLITAWTDDVIVDPAKVQTRGETRREKHYARLDNQQKARTK